MEQRTSSMQSRIDITYLGRALIQNVVLIALCGWIGGVFGFMSAERVNAPDFTSSAYMLIKSQNSPEELMYDYTLEHVAGQYEKIFTSSVMYSTIREEVGDEKLTGTISVQTVPGTNILTVNATSPRPMDAFKMLKTAISSYTKVSDYTIGNYYLEEFKSPLVPYSCGYKSHKRTAMEGAILCALLCAGVIVLLTFFKDDIKNEAQIEQQLDVERFATLYYEKKKRKNKKKSILHGTRTASFLYTENVNKMATRFVHRAEQEDRKVIMITSVQENEGKSTVAANLALALAAQNKKVLLVDADLRNPAMYKIFEKKLSEEQEIGAYLTGKQTLQDVLTQESRSGLYFLYGSKAYRDSDKMLRSEYMEELLAKAREAMDYVIIDTAPLAATNDAEILCKGVDGVFLVVRQGCSRVPMINEALDAIRANNTTVLGCIFNAVQTRLLPRAVEYGYGRYGDRYGYGNYNKTKR